MAKNPIIRNIPWSVGTRGLAGTSGPGLSKIFHFLQISKPAIAITMYIAALPIKGMIVSMVLSVAELRSVSREKFVTLYKKKHPSGAVICYTYVTRCVLLYRFHNGLIKNLFHSFFYVTCNFYWWMEDWHGVLPTCWASRAWICRYKLQSCKFSYKFSCTSSNCISTYFNHF